MVLAAARVQLGLWAGDLLLHMARRAASQHDGLRVVIFFSVASLSQIAKVEAARTFNVLVKYHFCHILWVKSGQRTSQIQKDSTKT